MRKSNLMKLAMAAALASMMLTACGGGSEPETTAAPATTAAAAETEAAEETEAEEGESIEAPITVVNNTGVEIYGLFASPEGEENWGDDLLDQDTLADGESGTGSFTFTADTLVWDFAMADSEGTMIEFYGLDFSEFNTDGVTITLEYDGEKGTATMTNTSDAADAEEADTEEAEDAEAAEGGEVSMTDLEGILTTGAMGLTDSGEGFYYAASDGDELSVVIAYNPETNESVSFVGPETKVADNTYTITDSTSQLSLTFEAIPQDDGTILLDLGDTGAALVAPCEVSEVLEAMQAINEGSNPLA